MNTIKKRYILDEKKRIVEVIIPYEYWKKIEKLIREKKGTSKKTLMKYSGIITLTKDPEKYQKEIRGEW